MADHRTASLAVTGGLNHRSLTETCRDPLAQTSGIMLGASLVLLANLLRGPSPLPRLRAAFVPYASSGVVTALAQWTLLERSTADA